MERIGIVASFIVSFFMWILLLTPASTPNHVAFIVHTSIDVKSKTYRMSSKTILYLHCNISIVRLFTSTVLTSTVPLAYSTYDLDLALSTKEIVSRLSAPLLSMRFTSIQRLVESDVSSFQ